MPQTDLVVFGDSVPWGQGLLDQHKYAALVRDQLAAHGHDLTVRMVAHSGATIGIHGPDDLTASDGEVPIATPTILEQITTYGGDPANAAVVLLNGGINDVNIRVILNPLTTLDDLHQKTRQYCLEDMTQLLAKAKVRFPNPGTTIVVTDYYPILSSDSHPMRAPLLLAVHGVAFAPFAYHDVVFDKIVALCTQFTSESTTYLQQAVHSQNDSRVVFVHSGFAPENAVFASNPWLFGVNADLSPQDEVIPARHAACDATYPPIDALDREACYRASAGHPNAAGAAQFATVVTAALC
jgi:hypothetical protein